MAIKVHMHQAKTELSRLVLRALAGEEAIITPDGKAVVRLEPVHVAREPGSARGLIEIADDFNAPLPDELLANFEDAE